MQNLRTVIVTADIHQGLCHSPPLCLAAKRKRRHLTFWHWSGVTPYTSTYVFAGSCVFGKQLPEILSLRPIETERRSEIVLLGRRKISQMITREYSGMGSRC